MESVARRAASVPGLSTLLVIDEQTQIGAARRSAVELGHGAALGPDAVGRLAIGVTEAATNIIRHAERGLIVLRTLNSERQPVIEVLALDNGPGIADIARAMRDGFSTSGTAGNGLGAIRRLADVFEIYSQPNQGTALLARIGDRHASPAGTKHPTSLEDRLGVVCVPLQGEAECGDAWRIVVGPCRTSVLLVDGLGHGPGAAAAAEIATTMFPRVASNAPEAMLGQMSDVMRDSRGAAISVVVLDDETHLAHFGGVGNVDGRVLANGETEYLVPQNGIIGHTLPALRSTSVSWPAGATLVMHSDGISARWRADAYPGLSKAHPALVAGVIYRDFGRPRDDATVLVLRASTAEERQ